MKLQMNASRRITWYPFSLYGDLDFSVLTTVLGELSLSSTVLAKNIHLFLLRDCEASCVYENELLGNMNLDELGFVSCIHKGDQDCSASMSKYLFMHSYNLFLTSYIEEIQ